MRELELDPAQLAGKQFFFGRGCDKCNFSGFKGRRAIYEIMPVTERIKRAVLDKASGGRLRELAVEEGMRPLRAAGLLAIFDGITTVEEVLRETVVER